MKKPCNEWKFFALYFMFFKWFSKKHYWVFYKYFTSSIFHPARILQQGLTIHYTYMYIHILENETRKSETQKKLYSPCNLKKFQLVVNFVNEHSFNGDIILSIILVRNLHHLNFSPFLISPFAFSLLEQNLKRDAKLKVTFKGWRKELCVYFCGNI